MNEPDTATNGHRRDVRRSVYAATLVLAILTVAGALVLNAGRTAGENAFHAELEFFAAFAALSIFFLAGAKYAVSRERVYLPVALASLAASLFDLAHPVLEAIAVSPELASRIGAPLEGTPFVALAGELAFGAGLLLAALSLRAPKLDERAVRNLGLGFAAVVIAALVLSPLIAFAMRAEYHIAALGGRAGWELAPLGLYVVALYFFLAPSAADANRPFRWVGIATLAGVLVAGIFAFQSTTPGDGAFFVAHATKVLAYFVLLFGLYLEHVRLYSVERALRESLEQAHGDLRAAKGELDAIIEDLTDGICITNERGQVLRSNRAAREILGRDAAGIPPDKFQAVCGIRTPEGAPFPVERHPIMQALRTAAPVRNVEFTVERPNGERRTLVAGAVPMLDRRGRVRGTVVAFSDVTVIRAAEQRFRDLTETAPDAIVVVDATWRIVLYNRAAEQLFGFPREEVFGRDVGDLIPKRLQTKHMAAREVFHRTGKLPEITRPISARGQRKDGSEVPVEVSISESRTVAGQYFIAHVRDVSSRERSRREREGLLSVATTAIASHTPQEFVERAAHAITTATDFDACTIYLHDPSRNALVLRAFDRLPEEVVERIRQYPLDPKFPSIAVQTWYQRRTLVESHLQERTELHVTPRLLTKYHFGTIISVPFGADTEPWGVIQVVASEGRNPRDDDVEIMELVAQEVTAGLRQHRLIEQLEATAKDLRAANQELDSFIYTASHDLAEPLRSISNFSHFLLEDYAAKLDDEGKDYLQRVHAGALRMKRLLDDLLRLSRHGRSKAQLVRLDVADVLNEVRDSLDAMARESQASLVFEGPFPPVVADRTSLVEVFVNLIGNGVKFNQSEVPQVIVRGRRVDGLVEFQVRDNGIGIPAEQRDRIFGLFTRLHTRKEYPGTGAGLAIVKKIVDNHGGKVWVESEVEKGSTFFFTVPAAPVLASKLEVAQARAALS